MKNTRIYTGVGSSKTPPGVAAEIADIAMTLLSLGYVLRTGNAGAGNVAFSRHIPTTDKIIINMNVKIPQWSYEEMKRYIPAGAPPLDNMNPYIRKLRARNIMLVLGESADEPSEFVICWNHYTEKNSGAIYAMRCATAHGIPTYNINNKHELKLLYKFLRYLETVDND